MKRLGYRKYILLLLFTLWCGGASGQIPIYDPVTGVPQQQIGEQIDYRTEEEKAADEAAELERMAADSANVKERKPLLSYYFDDTTRLEQRMFSWKVNTLYNTVLKGTIDTLLNGDFQTDYPFMAVDNGIGSAYLGIVGGATTPLDYFSRPNPANFSFLRVWDTYIKNPDEVSFYNTRLPYSRLDFGMSGQVSEEERLLNFILSHNVDPSTNINLEYSGEGTRGQYINQNTLVWNLALSFAHTGKRLSVHGGYIYNGGNIRENGGIVDDSMITDTVISSADQIEVNLPNSYNKYRGHTAWWTASYAIPLRSLREDELTLRSVPAVFVGNSFNYTLRNKTYSASADTLLYPVSYIDPDQTYDSIAQQMIDTRFFMQLQPYNRDGVVGLISAGVGVDYSAYYINTPGDMRQEWNIGGRMNRTTLYTYGDVSGKISRYAAWDADARFNLLGYRIGDFDAGGNIRLSAFTKKKQQPISLKGSVRFAMRSPDMWEEHYYSNHFRWNNDFTNEVSTTFGGQFSVEQIGLGVGAQYSITTGKIYYGADMLPAQYGGALNVLAVDLQKNFVFGGMNLNHSALFQYSSNTDVAPVPALSLYLNYYYAMDVVKNVLNMEFGVDGRYQTQYYGFGYNPALGQFYNQQEVQVGGFPFMDAYVSAKWKRMRILLKLQNWNVNLFGGRNYFLVAHYPQNRMMFKIKVSWSFYD